MQAANHFLLHFIDFMCYAKLVIPQVTTISFATLLESIPEDVEIKYILTDMQGYDFGAVAAAGHLLAQRGIKYIETEVFPDDVVQYVNANNDFCRDWLPHMLSHGYVLYQVRTDRGVLVEQYKDQATAQETCRKQLELRPNRPTTATGATDAYNALWRLATVPETTPDDFEKYYKHLTLPSANNHRAPNLVHTFTDEEYASCMSQ